MCTELRFAWLSPIVWPTVKHTISLVVWHVFSHISNSLADSDDDVYRQPHAYRLPESHAIPHVIALCKPLTDEYAQLLADAHCDTLPSS